MGGSLLTDRAHYREPDLETLHRLALEVANARAPLVLVHGAGSYGHVLAEKHRLHEGSEPRTPERLRAFAQVHDDVRELNALVLKALHRAGFSPVAVSPLEIAHTSAGALDRLDTTPFERSVTLGLTPVTFGDAVHDDARGWAILSGDVLATRLAVALGADLLLHATDVAGVHDRDPAQPGARLLPHLDADEAEALADASGARPGRADVTGGMANKLRHAAEAARAGCDVLVVDGRAEGRVADALLGRAVEGTWIRAKRA